MTHPNLYIIARPNGAGTMSERELESKVMEGLKRTHRKLVEQHRKTNTPLIFSENGVVQFVDPNTVEI